MAGELKAAPRKRDLSAAKIAARVGGHDEQTEIVDGVMPLAGGFFRLEAMRQASVAKLKAKKRGKVRS